MGLRHVAHTLLMLATVMAGFGIAHADTARVETHGAETDGAQVRIATYRGQSGTEAGYFAASIQPSAADALMTATTQAPADVVILVDTSASQVGEFRNDSIAAIRGIVGKLRPSDRVRVFAADVRATDLSGSFGPAASAESAVDSLKKRLPLGNTNMVAVIDAVRASLVAEPQRHTRSIVYIGDGASIDAMGDTDRFAGLIGALRADRIAVSSLAIGPVANVELMAVLANQTGGVVGVVSDQPENSPAVLAPQIGRAATTSPIWLTDAKLPAGMKSVQANRLPPLRLDRDSILIGTFSAEAADSGVLQLTGETSTSSVRIMADADLEASHPDFAFLTGLVDEAGTDNGLRLATAGSPLLRQTARMMAEKSEALVRAGNMALQQGNKRGAKAVAEMALQADPTNPEAVALEKAAGNRLVMQNEGGSLDDIFGGGAPAVEDPFGAPAAPAPAADDPFGAPAAPAPAADDPFGAPAADAGMGFGDDLEPAPAAPAAPAPAPRAVAPAPRAVAPAPVEDFGAFNDFTNPIGDQDLMEERGGLLDRVRSERAANDGRLRSNVRAALRAAERELRTDPTGVAGSLKSLLANVETTPDIDPQLRSELISQVRSAIRVASRAEAEYSEGQRNLEQVVAQANASSRLLEETMRRESTLKTLSQQMNALIDEGRYEEADGTVSVEFTAIAGDTITNDSVAGRHFALEPLMLQVYARDRRYQKQRERAFVDAFSLVLKSNIPFVDEPPIVYPDADVWQRLSRRRIERYGAIELVGDNETERRIQSALSDPTTQSFVELPLSDAIAEIARTHDIPIVIDKLALEEIGMSEEDPVDLSLKNVSLRSFLRLMLREKELTYVIKDEVMQITTKEAADENLINKVYPVGDLVVPVIQLGGGGGMGGGGMGGGGMGGGGMGGGGMGGGGMGGGGMGGGMGGGGGGMFAVPDDVTLNTKTQTDTPNSTETTPNPVAAGDAAIKPILIKPADGQTVDEAWDAYFAAQTINDARDLTILDQSIRSTVGLLSAKAGVLQGKGDVDGSVAQFAAARDAIAGAIRAGHVQPWMYQAYALALKATGAPAADIERALLSAVDFAETPDDLLNVAGRLEDIGSVEAALKLCQNASVLDPYRRETYVIGMRLARRCDNVDGLMWACKGILGQAWPESFQAVVEEARLVARATHADLIERGQTEVAAEFNKSLQLAASHDVIVRVSWTGDADIDLAVEEPSGTVCSLDNRSTAGGGTLVGDAFPGSASDDAGTVSETYLCPQGFSGQYRLLVRRVWGNVSTGRVTVEVLTDVGRPAQRFIRQEVPLTEKDALVVFEVKEGKRKEEIGEAQLANLRDVQRQVQNEVLGQFIGGPDNQQIATELFQDIQRATGGGGVFGNRNNGFLGRGAVGFRPELTVLPEGATLQTLAIISADRRYVRISPAPFFSQIGDVTTFNFVTGDEGGGAGGAGGIGGGAGGIGGGAGGIGGGGGGGFGN